MGKKFGISFSWKRAVGISGLKNRISRKTGIPLTSYGRQRKVGRMLGCSTFLLIIIVVMMITAVAVAKLIF